MSQKKIRKTSENVENCDEQPTANKTLLKHIKRIKKAKNETQKLFLNSKMNVAEASIELLWEIVFDYLCSGKVESPDELSSLSSVVQRLASSKVQLANFQAKYSASDIDETSSDTLTEAVINKIENALKLL